MRRILSVSCLLLLLSACASMGENETARAPVFEHPNGLMPLLGFIARGKAGEQEVVYDVEDNNAEGMAVIQHSYLAASGNSCRAYYWMPSTELEKTAAHNLNVACQTAQGRWYKVRTLSNIETLLEKEPVGYVLH